jgi:hypothetical protein
MDVLLETLLNRITATAGENVAEVVIKELLWQSIDEYVRDSEAENMQLNKRELVAVRALGGARRQGELLLEECDAVAERWVRMLERTIFVSSSLVQQAPQ